MARLQGLISEFHETEVENVQNPYHGAEIFH